MIPIHDENPTRRTPFLTIGLIGACFLVLLYQLSKPNDQSLTGQTAFICQWGLMPEHLVDGAQRTGDACLALNQDENRYVGLLTSQFLHAGWLHLIGNMLFLWVFGNNIEDRLGLVRFLPFYLLCGAAAGLAQALANPDSAIPLVGASGAISGVLGGYLVLYPRVKVWSVVLPFFFLPFRIPAWLWLVIYFVLQVVYLGGQATAEGGGGVAYFAHIGGFIAGALLILPFAAGRRPPERRSPATGPVYW